ncbi:MAG TPA: PspC domain-containing protein [Bacillales bacterium]|nr:PspC domain-containing protein [Bacillales bacterium]
MKKLVRSRRDRKIAGICGGLGEFLHIDSTVVRLIFVVVFIFSLFFPLGLLYIIGIFVIPKEDD